MDQENDQLLTNLAVRLINVNSKLTVGSGIIYWNPSLYNISYVLTAAHCLFEDSDTFQKPLEEIGLEFYNPAKDIYETLVHRIDHNLICPNIDNDVAILLLEKSKIEAITGKLVAINIVTNRIGHSEFVAKGFPSATNGKEIVAITPSWSQQLPEIKQFQLHINQDFSDGFSSQYRIDGFSGAGVFLYDYQQIYLYGIFTRFLDAGKIIYCQPVTKFEILLRTAYLPLFSYTFFGSHGITSEFFHKNARRSIAELGPRFNSKLNFQLPVASYFNALAKDDFFRQKVTRVTDKQLSASVFGSEETEIQAVKTLYNELNQSIETWYKTISWQGNDPIIVDEILEKINCFKETAEQKQNELYEKRYNLTKEDGNKTYGREAFSREISHLNNMVNNLSSFNKGLDSSHIPLSNHPVLLIKGNAGAGKSHLLGDILEKRNANGFPTILLLGQLFVSEKSLWENILQQLGLNCTQDEFLSTLNSIGEQIGTRVLLMVDAINEGAGKTLWYNGLTGFIHDCNRYPAIGLVLSIRTTYWEKLIPESVKQDTNITVIEHQGFKGNEYEAVKLFCEFYGIQQPNFPLMNPECSNPLFLHLICQGIQNSAEKIFPHGYQGITKVFGFYIKALEERLVKKREDYEYVPNLVKDSLNSFANACFSKEHKLLSLSETVELFNTEFPRHPSLLRDLIEESVLFRSLQDNYHWNENDDTEEIIYFAYERFGDFYMAAKLIAGIADSTVVLTSFQKEGTLGKLIENGRYENSGILEALAVLLPEQFGLEIFEVFEWAYKDNDFSYLSHLISDWYLNSLKWRIPDSIDYNKFRTWAKNTNQFMVSNHEYFNFLYEMCAVENHPFNSDRMTSIFIRYSMPKRDSFIQKYFYYYNGSDDSGVVWPVNRLIDWAWRPNISAETSHETARLVSQALSWILGSTDNTLRDQATKAMVNLLKDQVTALIEVFAKFIDIDDKYITERLCAVVYGCALRAKKPEDIKIIAQTVYDKIFRDSNPPEHLLLRDYCRHIVEFALSREIALDLVGADFRPPYNAALPEQYPTVDEVKVYEREKNEKGEESFAARANGRIIHSVLAWDFGRYTIDSAIENFECIEFGFEKEITKFREKLPRGGKTMLQRLKEMFQLYAIPFEKRQKLCFQDEERLKLYWSAVDALWAELEANFLIKLNEQQKEFYLDRLLPYWKLQIKDKNDKDLSIDKAKIKNWVVKRVFDLGYNGAIHGDFDNNKTGYHRSVTSENERIGKKYQWIAFYEILGILADNYKIRDRYSMDKKSSIYNGPWEITYRDIDPSFITKRNVEKYDEDDFGLLQGKSEWFFPKKYPHWNNLQDDWAETTVDLPSPLECIEITDPKGIEWLYLYSSYTWNAPKNVGESMLRRERKEIWYMFQGYLVPNSRCKKTFDWLKSKEFGGRWLPEAQDISNLFARECYWSPLSKEYEKEHKWRTLNGSNLKVMLPTLEAIGSLDKDVSGAHFGYKIPNRKIFEYLGLSYADIDGEFTDANGDILFSNLSPLGPMIRKDSLQKFLAANNLKIIWTLLGEKNSFYNRNGAEDIRKTLSGVFTIENNTIKGSTIKVTDW
ncbi:AVAST type 2 anti-phage system protein Avs2 [Elizabethkingia anophelis]|uniref:AVAST type 2 anti-phage system protein Avs2 n=1 Tax=Elizabethkingia anophelis TaxID=1117645 RepID=UPI00136D163C|nr:AVAST type 2 anti-phage system protein Avs2 [Elizabethkingia anophelis]MYY29514.1 ATP-binding protein [Elizabethkingia anophelis]HAY3506922.1 hypothetical protein [Elizabethkingia anophelis]